MHSIRVYNKGSSSRMGGHKNFSEEVKLVMSLEEVILVHQVKEEK